MEYSDQPAKMQADLNLRWAHMSDGTLRLNLCALETCCLMFIEDWQQMFNKTTTTITKKKKENVQVKFMILSKLTE